MQNAWSWAEPEAEVIGHLRDEMRDSIPSEWVEETDPHISILPGFEVPQDNMDNLISELEDAQSELVGGVIEVTGFHCYNPIEADSPTFVVGLDVEIDLETIRNEQKNAVEQVGGSLLYEPVNAHITLFKEGDGGDDNDGLTTEQATTVDSRLNELSEDAQFETTIQSVSIERF